MRNTPFHIAVCLLACSLFFGSCSSKDALSKVWFYTHDGSATSPSLAAAFSRITGGDPVLTPANFLNLQKDGKYTAYLDGFSYGNWTIKDSLIVLSANDKTDKKIVIQSLKKKELVLDVKADNAFRSSSNFEGADNDLAEEENPYSLTNNRWRIKATHKETDQEITERLRNHFRYWEKYFAWGLKTDRNYLDVRSLAGPLKMYGNGFQLINVSEWEAEWKNLFFDREDAMIAYNKLNYVFSYEKIAWAKTDHKFKMFVSAFQQLQQKID